MALHLSHTEGVTFNDISKDTVFYTTTSRWWIVLVLWLGAGLSWWTSGIVGVQWWSSGHILVIITTCAPPVWLHEVYHVWGEYVSNMTIIPSQQNLTIQILKHWNTFKGRDLDWQVHIVEKFCSQLWLQNFALGDHVGTCTSHSGVKKSHDWSVDQLAHLFHTTHKVKTQQVDRIRGQWCRNIDLVVFLSIRNGVASSVDRGPGRANMPKNEY
jgi:hypothetical protein